ncbi:MAG TPA: SCO family protein [Gemmatimonadales bacterium]
MRVTRFRFPGAPRPRALLLAAVLLPACRGDAGELSPGGYAGVELTQPRPKPDFTLTTTDGRPFDFRRETDGYLTFLFFGYTNCPDVCPVHMANLAAALDRLPRETARDVRVVFVTTDPARDTPARIREWLDAFDPGFIGLTGTPEELSDAQVAAGLLPAMADTAAGAAYEVGHAAQVLAYTPDNLLRVQYPFGTRQSDWAHDIPLLRTRSAAREFSAGDLRVLEAVAPAPPGRGPMALYLIVVNEGAADTLVAIESDAADSAALHRQMVHGGSARMMPAGVVAIPAGGTLRLEPGGLHAMLNGPRRSFAPGDSLRVVLRFRRAGALPVVARVVSYTELETAR